MPTYVPICILRARLRVSLLCAPCVELKVADANEGARDACRDRARLTKHRFGHTCVVIAHASQSGQCSALLGAHMAPTLPGRKRIDGSLNHPLNVRIILCSKLKNSDAASRQRRDRWQRDVDDPQTT
eukprot:4445505-Pleurochrysis_carterae.AAC.1